MLIWNSYKKNVLEPIVGVEPYVYGGKLPKTSTTSVKPVSDITPNNALTLNEELVELRNRIKEQEKEIRRLKEENKFLEEASAFFAASRWKSAKNRD